MMEAARTSETSVDNYFTQQYIPEDKSDLHTRRRENLKSHINESCSKFKTSWSCVDWGKICIHPRSSKVGSFGKVETTRLNSTVSRSLSTV
jgi:hypothetical protein